MQVYLISGFSSGLDIKPRSVNGQLRPWMNTVANFNLSWKAPCIEILQYVSFLDFSLVRANTSFQFGERTPGSFVEEREASIVWRFWTEKSSSAGDHQWGKTAGCGSAESHLRQVSCCDPFSMHKPSRLLLFLAQFGREVRTAYHSRQEQFPHSPQQCVAVKRSWSNSRTWRTIALTDHTSSVCG